MYAMWQTWSPSTRKAAGNVTSISFAELLLPPITFLALYFNSCLNPVLYALLSENFRKYLRELCGSHLLLLPIVRAHMRRRARQRRQQQYAMYIMVDGRRVSLGHNSCCTSQTWLSGVCGTTAYINMIVWQHPNMIATSRWDNNIFCISWTWLLLCYWTYFTEFMMIMSGVLGWLMQVLNLSNTRGLNASLIFQTVLNHLDAAIVIQLIGPDLWITVKTRLG